MSKFTLSNDSGFVVFSGNGCSKCTSLKNKLNASKVEFTEYNVHENSDAADFLRSKGLLGIPVVFINGQHAQLNG